MLIRSRRLHQLKTGARQWAELIDRAPVTWVVSYLCYVCLIVFVLTRGQVVGGDSPGIAYLPASILRHGTLRLDPFINQNPFFDLTRQPHYVVESMGHYYSKFSPVPSLLALPLYAISFWLQGYPGPDITAEASRYIALSRLSASLMAAAIVVVVFLALRTAVRQSIALLLAGAYAFGTFTWASATNTLASQSSGELFLALSTLILARSEEQLRRLSWRAAASIGFCLAMSVASRPQVLLAAGAMAVSAQLRAESKLGRVSLVVGGLPVVILVFIYNSWAFGSPLSTGYGQEAMAGWSTPLCVGLPGILLSPSNGLLFYAPLWLVSLWAGASLWQWRPSRRPGRTKTRDPLVLLGRFAAVSVFIQLLLMSHWHAWHGGVAYNQRMLQEVHPLMVMLIAVAIRVDPSPRIPSVLLWLTGLWGTMMNLVRVAFYDQHLPWVEVVRPELTWSLVQMEPMMYLRWHGTVGFLSGICGVTLTLASVLAVASAVFLRFLAVRQGADLGTRQAQ